VRVAFLPPRERFHPEEYSPLGKFLNSLIISLLCTETIINSLRQSTHSVGNYPAKKTQAFGLLSGGLDSLLAARLVLDQGILVTGLAFKSPFFGPKSAIAAAKALGIELVVKDITPEQKARDVINSLLLARFTKKEIEKIMYSNLENRIAGLGFR